MRVFKFTCDWCSGYSTQKVDILPKGWCQKDLLYSLPRGKPALEPRIESLTFCGDEHEKAYVEAMTAATAHCWEALRSKLESLREKWFYKKRREQLDAVKEMEAKKAKADA